jgi:peptide deformylase
LRYPSRPITQIDDDLRKTVRAMFDLMYAARGIGLAANQVALPYRFFVLNLTADPAQPGEEQVFINPEIVKRHSSTEDEEGCLSLPGLYAPIRRAKKIKLRAFDLEGKLVEMDAHDLLSRAIQHEADHLEGKLFIDYLDPSTRHSINPRIEGFEDEFRRSQKKGEFPSDDEIRRDLDAMERVVFRSSPVNEPTPA